MHGVSARRRADGSADLGGTRSGRMMHGRLAFLATVKTACAGALDDHRPAGYKPAILLRFLATGQCSERNHYKGSLRAGRAGCASCITPSPPFTADDCL